MRLFLTSILLFYLYKNILKVGMVVEARTKILHAVLSVILKAPRLARAVRLTPKVSRNSFHNVLSFLQVPFLFLPLAVVVLLDDK